MNRFILSNEYMKYILLSTLILFVTLCIYNPVFASHSGPFSQRGVMGLKHSDADIMRSTWEALRDNNLVGVKKEWNNPKTGRSGSIEVLKNFTDEEGRKCKQLRYKYSRKGFADTFTFIMDRCLVSEGKWKFK